MSKIAALLKLLVPEIQTAFLEAMAAISDGVVLAEITAAIEVGDYSKVYALLNITNPVFRPLTRGLQDAFERLADARVAEFPARLETPVGSIKFRFDVRNERAETWLKQQSSDLVTRISDDVRNNIRNVMTDAIARGQNPRQTALDIVGRIDPATGKRVGGIVGLTKNQERWAASARRKLESGDETYFDMALRDKRFDATVRKAFTSGKPLPVDTVQKLVTRYKDNALRYRGEQIAITETIAALNKAEDESIRQAVASGAIRAQDVRREWDDVGDTHTRHTHRQMRGQTVGLDEPFVTPEGDRLMYPGDPSLGARASEIVGCRCRVKIIVDWLAKYGEG
jgi:hypothetical protein